MAAFAVGSPMKRAVYGLFVLMIAAIGCDKKPDLEAMDIARRVATFAEKPTWAGVVVKRATGEYYELEIVYADAPKNYEGARADTRWLTNALLAEIKSSGEEEQKKLINIVIWTSRYGAGETNKLLQQDFGWSTYNHLSDTFEYKTP